MSNSATDLALAALALDAAIRGRGPLVHHITNLVVMNFTANVTLGFGAQPVMAHAPEELEQMTSFAGTLILNIGTLERAWIEAMLVAGRAAARRGTPIVLDPVGAGATQLRTDTARRLLGELPIAVLRGNAGEILAVAGETGKTRGVDSLAGGHEAADAAAGLARELKTVVAITGAEDRVTDGTVTYLVRNGHPMLCRVTGTGCAATTAIGCFVAVAPQGERCFATAAALAIYGRAAELAASLSAGPGSFVPALLDAIHRVPQDVAPATLRLERQG